MLYCRGYCKKRRLKTINIKRIATYGRKFVKLLVILTIAIMFILGLIQLVYRQTYSVSLKGEIIGYTNNKVILQKRINDYIKSGDGYDIAFVDMDEMPVYHACLLRKNIETNDDEMFEKIVASGTKYVKYYAIVVGEEEKKYVKDFSEAENIVNQLKEKKSANIDTVKIITKYDAVIEENESEDSSEEKTNSIKNGNGTIEVSSVEDAVNDLYVRKVASASTVTSRSNSGSSAYKNIGTQIQSGNVVATSLGFSLMEPLSGYKVNSPFSMRWGRMHQGIDLGTINATPPIKAAAAGTVTYSAFNNGGYGNLIKIAHANGVETVYGHCSARYVQAGQTVAQGQVIGAVGSTGRSTGNHLHFEIRINGNAVNPQNYIY